MPVAARPCFGGLSRRSGMLASASGGGETCSMRVLLNGDGGGATGVVRGGIAEGAGTASAASGSWRSVTAATDASGGWC